jgi:hypothetical protein
VDVVCVPTSERIFPMLRAVLERNVYGWSSWEQTRQRVKSEKRQRARK